MVQPRTKPHHDKEPKWLSDLVDAEPRAPLMAPFMAYLLLMGLMDLFPQRLQPMSMALHIGLAAWVTYLFRRHLPPWGKLHPGPAIIVGLLAAWLWVSGQHLLDAVPVGDHTLGQTLSLGWHLPFLHLEEAQISDPHADWGGGGLFALHVGLKIGRAVTIVPIVEELFWRGFILRAFISWNRFEQVPWGKFGWVAFFGSSLLSVLQHPANWGVSIPCWMLFNALFYWKRSLSCLVLTHAVTNLALYTYVVLTGDWRFW